MSFRPRKPPSSSDSHPSDNGVPRPHPLPTGVLPSTHTSDPITSWGLRAIDVALGGGLPLSTLTIVAEDKPTSYHIPLVSYVSAQGLANGHAVAVASFSVPAATIIQNLPAKVDSSPPGPTHPLSQTSVTAHGSVPIVDMKIAWRYRTSNSRPIQALPSAAVRAFTTDFDMSQPSTLPTNAALSCLPLQLCHKPYLSLLENISQHLKKASERGLLSRIIVHGVTTAIERGSNAKDDLTVVYFLCRLRSLTRVYGAVAVVSVAPDVSHAVARTSADALIQLDSFNGRGASVAGLGAEWLGVLIIKKTFRYGAAPAVRGRGDVWVFKRGRRKYSFERATAAPEDDDATDDVNSGSTYERDADGVNERSPTASLLCGPNSKGTSSYEF